MITLGDLADKLKELADAEDAVAAAERSLDFGGNPGTIQRKTDWLQRCRDQVTLIRAQPTNLVVVS